MIAGSLAERIAGSARRFDFFQLAYLLETLLDHGTPIGRSGPYSREGLRLRPHDGLTFAPADVRAAERAGELERGRGESWAWRVTVTFMGLYGVASPTPVYLSELIGFTDVDADPLTDYLDLFNHRILSLYYRAWLKYRYPYRYERGARDEFSTYVLSFAGLRGDEVRRQVKTPVARLIKYTGLLSMRTRPPVALARLLSDYLKVPVDVQQWQLRWVTVPPEGRNRIGQRNCTLGLDCTVGERVPDRSGKIRVSVGPLPFEEYVATLPDSERYHTLRSLTDLWVVDRFEHDVEVRLHGDEVPRLEVRTAAPARLGWTSWVTSAGGVQGTPGIVFGAPPPDQEGRL